MSDARRFIKLFEHNLDEGFLDWAKNLGKPKLTDEELEQQRMEEYEARVQRITSHFRNPEGILVHVKDAEEAFYIGVTLGEQAPTVIVDCINSGIAEQLNGTSHGGHFKSQFTDVWCFPDPNEIDTIDGAAKKMADEPLTDIEIAKGYTSTWQGVQRRFDWVVIVDGTHGESGPKEDRFL